MIKTTVFFVTVSLAAYSHADNLDCAKHLKEIEYATTIPIISGPAVAKDGERSQKIRDVIAESKKNGLRDCEILNELKPLLLQN